MEIVLTKQVDNYIQFLHEKGFRLSKESVGFIFFGQQYSQSSDELVITAIEVTLKVQHAFDGSFYISLLELFRTNHIQNRKEAQRLLRNKNIV